MSIKPGDTIDLDCGFGPAEYIQPCKVLEVFEAQKLFGPGKELCARVQEPGGNVFTTTICDLPLDK